MCIAGNIEYVIHKCGKKKNRAALICKVWLQTCTMINDEQISTILHTCDVRGCALQLHTGTITHTRAGSLSAAANQVKQDIKSTEEMRSGGIGHKMLKAPLD